MKNPLTTAGIEPVTSQFVAQHLNHCATAVPTPEGTSVALSIHHAVRIRHIVFLSVIRLTIIFFTLSNKWHDFRMKKLLNTKCVDFLWFRLEHFLLREGVRQVLSQVSVSIHVR